MYFEKWRLDIEKLSRKEVEQLYITLSLLEIDYQKKVRYLQQKLWKDQTGDIQDFERKGKNESGEQENTKKAKVERTKKG